MKRSHFTAPTCAAILSITSLGVTGTAALAQSAPDLDYETVLTDLDNPWDMAFLPDGTMFYTEKCLGLSVLLPSGETNALLGMTGSDGYASTADDLFCEGQAGMMGIALDPEFDDNRFIYVYSTSSMQAPGTNRLMRFVVSNDLSDVSDRTDLIEDVPYKPEASDQPFGGPGAHNGGRVRFGPDGYLYLTTGDIHGAEVPQSPTLLGGKVVRIDRDGNAAEGNNAPKVLTRASIPMGIAMFRASRFILKPVSQSLPNMGPGTRTKSRRWCPAATAAGIRGPIVPAGATAQMAIAAMSRCKWKPWNRPSAQPTCL